MNKYHVWHVDDGPDRAVAIEAHDPNEAALEVVKDWALTYHINDEVKDEVIVESLKTGVLHSLTVYIQPETTYHYEVRQR